MSATNLTEFALVVPDWFDGERRFRDGPYTFRVNGGVIAEIATGDYGAALERQGIAVERGGFLMPGLVDAHAHLFLDGAPTDAKVRAEHLKQPLERLTDAARASARQARACGVTLVRDAGDRHGINNRIRAEALDGTSASSGLPRVRSGGLGVKRARRYGAFMATDVSDDDSIAQSVTRLAADNDEIKIILTGIIDFDAGAVTDAPQFTLAEAELIVRTARAAGRSTFAHCSGEQGLAIAAAAGIGSIEHGFFMNRATLETMAANGVAWTPTFCPVHFQWAHPEAVGWSPQTVGNLRRILDDHARHLCLAQQLGVRLLLGTDAGSMGIAHGHAVFDEIERYLEAGLTLEATLRAATSSARRHFGDARPVLAAGAAFDALLLARSPFEAHDSATPVAALRAPRRNWLGAHART
jgi:imidazolonepropionase-like amidohydrolase